MASSGRDYIVNCSHERAALARRAESAQEGVEIEAIPADAKVGTSSRQSQIKDAIPAVLARELAYPVRNWMIGAYLVEFEQDGADRAAYGAGLLSRLSRDLRQHEVKGVSPDVLERMRLLYLHYPPLHMHISATMTRNSEAIPSSGNER
jgi:hypothetical protein